MVLFSQRGREGDSGAIVLPFSSQPLRGRRRTFPGNNSEGTFFPLPFSECCHEEVLFLDFVGWQRASFHGV